jgi:hypothetical protein
MCVSVYVCGCICARVYLCACVFAHVCMYVSIGDGILRKDWIRRTLDLVANLQVRQRRSLCRSLLGCNRPLFSLTLFFEQLNTRVKAALRVLASDLSQGKKLGADADTDTDTEATKTTDARASVGVAASVATTQPPAWGLSTTQSDQRPQHTVQRSDFEAIFQLLDMDLDQGARICSNLLVNAALQTRHDSSYAVLLLILRLFGQRQEVLPTRSNVDLSINAQQRRPIHRVDVSIA